MLTFQDEFDGPGVDRSTRYSAGEIDTRDKFNQQYGYIEARIKCRQEGESILHVALVSVGRMAA